MQIYLITNLNNGKKYVGQHEGSDLEKYWGWNVRRALRGSNKKPYLYAGIRKHGKASFKVETILLVENKEQADYHETRFIKEWNTNDREYGYNLTEGGDGVSNPSPETREKLAALRRGKPGTNLGKHFSEEHKQRLRESNVGKKRSQEARDKMSIASLKRGIIPPSRKGIPHTIETRKRMMESQKRRREKEIDSA